MIKTVDQILAELNRADRAEGSRPRRRRRKTTISKKHFNSWTWNSIDTPSHIMSSEKIFIGANDYGDYLYSQLLVVRGEGNKSTFNRDLKLHGNRSKWTNFIETQFDGDHIIELSESNGIIITEGANFIRYDVNSNSITARMYGDAEFNATIAALLEENFEVVTSYIEWVYSSDGSSVNVPLNTERLPLQEMYPFLEEEPLASYYDRFLASPANILLLIGPPGTGKTTFIRGLLAHSNSSAIVTYDSAILEKDYLFARFIEDETGVMVLEDSDNFLKARSDGNTMMHRFLNVGDGLVTTKGKKLIFSTNLPSIRDVDPALVRPGRCFDILNFAPLNGEQAAKLAEKLGTTYDKKDSGTYSIAEIFNKQLENNSNRKVGSKMGFI
jgi:hypothetical protein